MATYTQTVRRGLPRRPGGDPWPAGGDSPVAEASAAGTVLVVESAQRDRAAITPLVHNVESVAASAHLVDGSEGASSPERTEVPQPHAAAAAFAAEARATRSGLPRVPGGEPWPPAASISASAVTSATSPSAWTEEQRRPSASIQPELPVVEPDLPVAAPDVPVAAPVVASVSDADVRPLRRGLPRTRSGEPWPPAGFAPAALVDATERVAPESLARKSALSQQVPPAEYSLDAAGPAASAPGIPQEVMPAASGVVAADVSTPLPFTRTVWAGKAARTRPQPSPEQKRIGPFTRLQWAGAVIVGGGGLLFAAGMAVLAARFLLSLEPMQEFLAAYPGEYHLPEGAPVGIPPWLGWQHFFNVFLMVLIIRSGLRVRTEERPTAFWSPRGNPSRKISLNLWFHQSLDILWILNGVTFVILLFVTGQWMKIVPTSWEVFPNAISAALQYVSLDWPTENGWVNYNSLQQLAYFATVFLAAPLAIITGVRMSGIWPKDAKTLDRIYPVEWARAIHFPVMLYFVVFIALHVFLVLATGALRNLNHMYASQGSTDPNAYADNWVGFWIFVASLVVIAAAWVAARPLVLAPIARLFGKVSGR